MQFRTNVSTVYLSALAIILGFTITACGDRTRTNEAGDTLTTPMGMMGKTDSALILGTDVTQMTDGAILAFLTEANAGEITVGKIAVNKGTEKSVRNFAQEMIDAHTKMQRDGEALAERLNIMPEPMTSDSTARMNSELEARLNLIDKGPAFDTAYIKGQINAHERVLNFANSASSVTNSADLKQMLTDVVAQVQHHLGMAKDVEDDLPQ